MSPFQAMDLSKEFDCLPHNLLLLEIKSNGISVVSLDLIESYLNNRKQCVNIESFNSKCEEIVKDVSKGSILGPILFNIFLMAVFSS